VGPDGVVRLTSPITGRVLSVAQISETVLGPGQLVMELGDPVDLEIVAEVLSEDAVRIGEGAPAMIEAWGGDRDLRAEVRRVEPFGARRVSALGVEEQRVNVILDLLDAWEDWSMLGHGYRVRPRIEIWRDDDALQVPVAALFRHEAAWAVFVVDGGRARLRPVEAGRNDRRNAQIVSGLQPGDQVVLYPSDRIRDGVRVRARCSGARRWKSNCARPNPQGSQARPRARSVSEDAKPRTRLSTRKTEPVRVRKGKARPQL
ncbi:MAG: efflux RND transporter periplasmic adaptor subunit, partial [Oceanicaulis sp.]|nr:efflux RND transporter periplasmic adaptor subunit [Oceanicaulis sp.]